MVFERGDIAMRIILASVFGLIMGMTPAFAQNNDMRAVMSRMDQLQRQMDTVSRQVYNGRPPAGAVSNSVSENTSGMAAAMDERLNSIEGSMRQINSRLDEQDHALSQLTQQFELFKGDLEIRLKEMGTQSTSSPTSSPRAEISTPTEDRSSAMTPIPDTNAATEAMARNSAQTGGAADTQTLPNDSAAALYDASFQALREQKYDRAEAGFKEFLQLYKNDALAGNAQYWLGESNYARGNYQEAAKIFATGYQKYPKSSKGPDNLLKLGLSLAQTGKKQEACITLQQLGSQYANAAAVIKQRAQDEIKKLGCSGATG